MEPFLFSLSLIQTTKDLEKRIPPMIKDWSDWIA